MAQPHGCWAGLTLDHPRVMGILNVTPDSFSDGGTHADPSTAITAGLAMAAEGADIIDVGGESTRPGAPRVPPEVEIARVVPVVRALAAAGLCVSIDTRNAATMAAALDAGARIVNDVSGLTHDPAARRLVADRACPVVLMHMRGTPDTMVGLSQYDDVVADVCQELMALVAAAEAAGVGPPQILIDPGIGFAKKAEQSMAILRALPRLVGLGYPVLVGVSRKSFIGALSGETDPSQRLGGSLAAGLFALSRGASVLRVHDVRETVQAVRTWQALSV